MPSLNAVNNNAPAGAHAQANASDANVTLADQPAPKAPPGSIGHQSGEVQSQLVSGNPGGVGVGFGLGSAFDVSS
jgi:hypothetical protein